MNKTAIIIPTRLAAKRLPNKPLKLINNKEMIFHVYEAAVKSNAGKVIVATPDKEIVDLIKRNNGNAILTSAKHETGTDRVYEVFNNFLNAEPEIIINLQGDMPNIDYKSISYLADYMSKNKCEVGTLASDFSSIQERNDANNVKVVVEEKLLDNTFQKALDFFRVDKSMNHVYHHIGIYGFTRNSLKKYVHLDRSKLELERKLEQLRALENDMAIHVGYTKFSPLSVDTEEDLKAVKKLMEI